MFFVSVAIGFHAKDSASIPLANAGNHGGLFVKDQGFSQPREGPSSYRIKSAEFFVASRKRNASNRRELPAIPIIGQTALFEPALRYARRAGGHKSSCTRLRHLYAPTSEIWWECPPPIQWQ